MVKYKLCYFALIKDKKLISERKKKRMKIGLTTPSKPEENIVSILRN